MLFPPINFSLVEENLYRSAPFTELNFEVYIVDDSLYCFVFPIFTIQYSLFGH